MRHPQDRPRALLPPLLVVVAVRHPQDRPRALLPPLLLLIVVVTGEGEKIPPRLSRQGAVVVVRRHDEVTGCVPDGQMRAAPSPPPSLRSGPIDPPSSRRGCLRPAAAHRSGAARPSPDEAPGHATLRSHRGLARAAGPPRPADTAVAPKPRDRAQPSRPSGRRLSRSRRAAGIDGCRGVDLHSMGRDGRMAQ